jgi:hypothetical protein
MTDYLKERLYEAEHPVGVKKYSNWKLPPPDFAYGLRVKPDPEGVSISKKKNYITIFILYILNNS